MHPISGDMTGQKGIQVKISIPGSMHETTEESFLVHNIPYTCISSTLLHIHFTSQTEQLSNIHVRGLSSNILNVI